MEAIAGNCREVSPGETPGRGRDSASGRYGATLTRKCEYGAIAQLVEQEPLKLKVAGSMPAGTTMQVAQVVVYEAFAIPSL